MNSMSVRRFRIESQRHESLEMDVVLDRTAVIAVDVYGPANRTTTDHIAPVLHSARAAGVPVVYANNSAPRISLEAYEFTCQRFRDSAHDFPSVAAVPDADPREYHSGDGPWWQFDPSVAPQPADYVVRKLVYSGFFETPLDRLLRGKRIDTVVCVGFSSAECLLSTVMDASFRNYTVIVLRDCVGASDSELEASFPGSWSERMIVLMETYLCVTATGDQAVTLFESRTERE